MKNDQSVLSQALRLFNSTHRLLITGTPLQVRTPFLLGVCLFFVVDILLHRCSFFLSPPLFLSCLLGSDCSDCVSQQNNLHELWALLNFLLPEIFDAADAFDSWFQGDDDTDASGVLEQLHKVPSSSFFFAALAVVLCLLPGCVFRVALDEISSVIVSCFSDHSCCNRTGCDSFPRDRRFLCTLCCAV